MNKKIYAFFLLSVAAIPLFAAPPPVPSAGIVERELEKEYDAIPLDLEKEAPPIQIDIPRETLQFPEYKKIYISHVKIQGNTVFKESEILKWIGDKLYQKMSLADIYKLCEVIDQNYAKKGYFLARTYPPPQDIKNETLTLEILEGKLGNIKVEGNHHYSEGFIRGYFAHLQNKPLQYNQFLKALMLLNENTDLMVGSVFEKGEKFGFADVILKIKDARPMHLYLNGNNYGRNLTTNVRAGGRFDAGNIITQGDTFSLAEVVGFPVSALYFTDATYTVPLNRKGTFLEGEYLFSKFKVEEQTSLHMKGISNIATLKVTQAVLRRRTLNLDFFSFFDFKQIQNYVLHERTSFDKLRPLTVGALIDHSSSSHGRDYLTLRFTAGLPKFLGGLKSVDSESSRKGGGGRFFIFNADYDRLQQLPKDCFFSFHGSGQLSPSKLTVPEQIYIGGADTVRGFPLSVALGDNGYYLNFELRIPPPIFGNMKFFKSKKKWKEVLQFDGFLDHGGAFLQSEKNTILWGSGLGVRVNLPLTLSFTLDVGFPLNHRDLSRSAFTYIKITGQPF